MSVRSVCVRRWRMQTSILPLPFGSTIQLTGRVGQIPTMASHSQPRGRKRNQRSANGKILSRKTHSIPESGNPYALRSENRFQDSPSSGSSSSMKPARRTGGYKLFKFAASRRARAWAVRGVVSPLSEAGSSCPGFAYSRRSSGTVGVKSLSVVLVGDRGDDLLPSGVRGEKGRNADGETGVLGGDRNVA